MTVNMLSTLVALFVCRFAGRRMIMLVTQACMVISLVSVWVCQSEGWDVAGLIIVNIYIVCFELGSGAIVWPFIADICNEKGMSIGIASNWFWTLVIASTADTMNQKWTHGQSFLVFGTISAIGFFYIFFYMKETKGLTETELKRLYRSDSIESKAKTADL